jgi:ubiquinone biosynthesis UbiH/UbiF/VisC/COQ6 family hydroxylase
VCEGRDSASRAELDLAYESSAYGQTAIATHLACSLPHQHTAYQWFDEQGNILALLPRAQSAAGAACTVALVWSLAENQGKEKLSLSDADFCTALQSACSAQLGAMHLLAPRAAWPLKLAQAAHWCGQAHGKSWVLLGDAAHSMHPLAGQGLNVGLADAAALAQTLAARPAFRSVGDMRLLRSWERSRRADWQRMRLTTDGIQRLFTHDAALAQLARHWGMRAFDALPPLKNLAMRAAQGQGAAANAAAYGAVHGVASALQTP